MARADQLKAFVRRHAFTAALVGLLLVLLTLTTPGTEAHKAITSKYTFTDHVFPILRDRCARCHYQGGPTPMSLTTYNDALPWAESIREQLVGERMPPWYADPAGPQVKGGHFLPTRELDVLVTWAVGGTPIGDLSAKLPVVPAPEPWKAGAPDHKIKMESAHNLPAGTQEEDKDFTLSTGLTEEKWVKAVDLLPGETSMVRDAVISLENGPVLATWVPGYDATAAPNGTGFKLPVGAKIQLKMHYKKSWLDEQNAKSDESTLGLYFTDAPLSGKSIESVDVKGPTAPAEAGPTKFSGELKGGARVLAIRPSFDQAYQSATIEAVLPNGRRVTVMQFRAPQPQWYRRYWLVEPIELPGGTKLEVKATPAVVDEFSTPAPKRYPLQVSLDYVAP
jgi:hypothetical protein